MGCICSPETRHHCQLSVLHYCLPHRPFLTEHNYDAFIVSQSVVLDVIIQSFFFDCKRQTTLRALPKNGFRISVLHTQFFSQKRGSYLTKHICLKKNGILDPNTWQVIVLICLWAPHSWHTNPWHCKRSSLSTGLSVSRYFEWSRMHTPTSILTRVWGNFFIRLYSWTPTFLI